MITTSQAEGRSLPPGRHRVVRVVRPRENSRFVYFSLAAALLTPLTIFGFMYLFRVQAEDEPRQRSLSQIQLPWVCQNGHEFVAPGQRGSAVCPQCGAPADICTMYYCPDKNHGPYRVFLRYPTRWNKMYPDDMYMRLGDGEWVSGKVGLHCPRCGKKLYRPSDPIKTLRERE